MDKPRVAITFREGGENGGPYISHKRVMESSLKDKYEFIPLMVPVARKLRTRSGMADFVDTIIRINPDLVHFAGLQLEGFFVLEALKKAGIDNTLLAIHGSTSEAIELAYWKKIVLKFLERQTVKQAKYCFAVSDYVNSWPMTQAGGNCLGVAYNMLGSRNLIQDRGAVRSRLGIPDDAFVVVSTGRIIAEKGYDCLLPICDLLLSDGLLENIYFLIVGDGNYLSSLSREVGAKEYADHVRLLGYKKNVADYLNASDLYWTSTKHETLGCSIIEACDASLPVVASKVGGIPEIIIDGQHGHLVEVGDIRGFASAIEHLYLNVGCRVAFGQQAAKHARQKFSDQAVAVQLDNFYQKTLGRA